AIQKENHMATEYDVVVVGAGPGGYTAAIRAAQLGLKTAVVEKRFWGGVCLNIGCIPSKALLYNAEIAHILNNERQVLGINVEGSISMDYSVAHKRSRQVSGRLSKGVQFLMKKNKITSYDGWGKFTGPNDLQVELEDGKTEDIRFKNAILATGATARLIPGTQLSDR